MMRLLRLMGRPVRLAAMTAFLVALGAGPAGAQSPGPSGSPRGPVDCADLEVLLPTDLGEGLGLTAEVGSGVDGFEPDDMLDPLLGSLGLGRDDVCSVGIRYGSPPTDLIGLLVRVRGAGPGLAGNLAGALAERLREYGSEVLEETFETPGGSATRLRIHASGTESQLLVTAATTDTALLTGSESLLDALPLPGPGPSLPASPLASAPPSLDPSTAPD